MTEPAMAHRPSRSRAGILVAAVLSLLQISWLAVVGIGGTDDSALDVEAADVASTVDIADLPLPRADGSTSADAPAAAATQEQVPVQRPVQSLGASPEAARFTRLFAAQANAIQDPSDPATTRWAVLIGINDYQAPTRDNVGSRQDAVDLNNFLLSLGWRSDHIVLLTDLAATRPAIEQAIAWLASKTDAASTAVFHYSGHTKQLRNADADAEVLDELIWPSDNRHMADRELVNRLAAVNASRLWINFSTCEAAGFAEEDEAMRRPGRLLTFSSQEPEKSYEDPSRGNSVWGYFLFERGLIGRASDPDGNGDITVQEAFGYAAPQSTQRTAQQRPYGPQHPVMIDDAGAFSLRIPPRVQRPPVGSEGERTCIGSDSVCLPPARDPNLP